jgi:hypothetical protein
LIPKTPLRFGIEGGYSHFRFKENHFMPFVSSPSSGSFDKFDFSNLGNPSHTHTTEIKNVNGANIKAKLDIPFLTVCSFFLQYEHCFNPYRSFNNYSLGFSLGKQTF